MQSKGGKEPDCLFEKPWRYSLGGSGAPPTCRWLRSRSVALSSSLMPRVKFGSFNRWLRADSGMFCSTCNRCLIACLRSGCICCHLGSTSLRMCWRCSAVSLFQTWARSCNSCRCAGGSFCSRRLSSATFCFSCGLRLLKYRFGGAVYADGGRFGLLFGRAAVSARFAFEFCGPFAPDFCRPFCALRASCCCCLCTRLCSCLCCCCC